MRKCVFLLFLPLILSGCGGRETMETVADQSVEVLAARPAQVSVRLPDGAVAPVLEEDSQQIYTAEDYEIIIETLSAGDLSATIRSLSGYERESLTVMETEQSGCRRYEFVWTSAGEEGDRLGRAVILDDGQYHYCMTVLRDADTKQNIQIVWNDVFSSFDLA